MGINFKPINEVPEITEISEGDKLLVSSGGEAKQIDAGMFAASGGASAEVIHIAVEDMSAASVMASAYADAEMTQMMTYAQGKAALLAGNAIRMHNEAIAAEGAEAYAYPVIVQAADAQKVALAFCYMIESMLQFTLTFSDTAEEA